MPFGGTMAPPYGRVKRYPVMAGSERDVGGAVPYTPNS